MLPYDNPKQLVNKLKEYIIGQDVALNQLSLYLFKNCIQYDYQFNMDYKSILLLAGQTGCGKTFMIRKATELMNLPLIEINSKSICQEGWQGQSFKDHLAQGLRQIDYTHPKHKHLIIVLLDEFDKICIPLSTSDSVNINLHTQYSILKYLEASTQDKFKINSPEGYCTEYTSLQFCFIFSGNFEEVRQARIDKRPGFLQTRKDLEMDFCTELEKFGMIPEIVGRISETLELEELTSEVYRSIWNNEHFFIQGWLEYFKGRFETLEFENLREQAITKTLHKNVGVRGLIQEANYTLNTILEENPSIFSQYTKDLLDKQLLKFRSQL